MKQLIRETLVARILSVFTLVFGLIPTAAYGDLLVTGSGDSLSGTMTRIASGILVFKTSLQGQMMVPMTEVKSLSTDGTWIVTEADGTVRIGRFVPEGFVRSAGGGGETSEVVPMALDGITTAKPLPPNMKPAGADTEPAATWSASGRTGVRAFSGTEDGFAPHIGVDLRRWGAADELTLQLDFDGDGEDDFPRYMTGSFELTGRSSPVWGPFVQALLERNTSEALKLRTGLTLGIRYAFSDTPDGTLEGLAGLGVSHGEWNRRYLDSTALRWTDDVERETDVNLHLGLRYARNVWGGTWENRLFLLPALTDADHFRAGAASSLIYPLSTRLQLRLDMLMNYDPRPVFDELDTVDTSLGASIQLAF